MKRLWFKFKLAACLFLSPTSLRRTSVLREHKFLVEQTSCYHEAKQGNLQYLHQDAFSIACVVGLNCNLRSGGPSSHYFFALFPKKELLIAAYLAC